MDTYLNIIKYWIIENIYFFFILNNQLFDQYKLQIILINNKIW